jgi:peptide/nickel transport system substrate-binding protein
MNAKKVGALSLSLLLGLSGCAASSGADSDETTLTVGTSQEMSGVFSPLYYLSGFDGDVINLIYQGMLKYDANSELQPELAEELPTVSDDGLTVTFKLKEGVKFSDGTELTSSDVKYTFTVLSDPSYTGYLSTVPSNIVGYDDYYEGDAKELSGIETPDDYTVIFHLTSPMIDAVSTLGTQPICSDEQYDYVKGKTKKIEKDSGNPIGTGAYKLYDFDKSKGATFVKNDEYDFQDGEYQVDRIIIQKTDTSTELSELKKGDVDLLPANIEQTKIGQASLDDDLEVSSYKTAGEGFLGFNCANGTTVDQAVRQALCYAIDRQSFVDSFFKYDEASDEIKDDLIGYVPEVYWNPVSSLLGSYVTGEETLEGLTTYTYDLDKASQILDDAGWVMGDDGIREKDGQKLEVKFLVSQDVPALETLIPMFKSAWNSIGIDLKQSSVDYNTVLSTISDDEQVDQWNIYFVSSSYSGVIDSDANTTLATGNPYNFTRIEDEELDTDLTNGLNTSDEATAVEWYSKAMIRENELVPYFPLYGTKAFNLYSKKVKGLTTGPVCIWSQAMKDVKIKD